MSLFHRHGHADPLNGGDDGVFEVAAPDGRTLRYVPDDFDEIFTTTDEREAGRHVGLGWLLLDEFVGRGRGPARVEFVERPVSHGGTGGQSFSIVPVEFGRDDVTVYVLGYLKPGRSGSPA